MVVLKTLYYQNGNMSIIKGVIMKVFLGKNLKDLRLERGYTQKQVAEMLNINSVTYLHYEKEQREPPLSLLADMAKLYDVSVDFLLGLEEY